MKALVTVIPLLLLAAASAASERAKDPVDTVDTSIGTISHMLVPTFPTIQRPNGMLRIVPPNESFTTDRIGGFGLSVPSHRQGQVFQLMVASGDAAALRTDWTSRFDHSVALPYRYSVFLDDHDATVAFAPGRRAAICAVGFERPAAGEPRELRPAAPAAERVAGDRGSDDHRNGPLSRRDRVPPRRARPVAGAGGGVRRRGPRLRPPGHSRLRRARGGRLPRFGASGAAALRDLVRQRRPGAAEPRGGDPRLRPGEAGRRGPRRVERHPRKGGLSRAEPRTRGRSSTRRSTGRTSAWPRISEDGRYFSAWDGRVHDDGGVPFWTDDWVWDTFHALHPLNVLLNPGCAGREAHVVRPRFRAVGLDADVPHRLRRRAQHERAARGRGVRGRVAQGHPGLRPRARLRLHEEDHPSRRASFPGIAARRPSWTASTGRRATSRRSAPARPETVR